MNPTINTLEDFIFAYGTEIGVGDISDLDGFLAAIVCSPTPIDPSRWFPVIWGGKEHEPYWLNTEEVQTFSIAVIRHYDAIVTSFKDEAYSPLFLEFPDESDVVVVTGWCDGFIRGLKLWRPLSGKDDEFFQKYTFSMGLFSYVEMLDFRRTLTEEEIKSIQQAIPEHVRAIYRYFHSSAKDADTSELGS